MKKSGKVVLGAFTGVAGGGMVAAAAVSAAPTPAKKVDDAVTTKATYRDSDEMREVWREIKVIGVITNVPTVGVTQYNEFGKQITVEEANLQPAFLKDTGLFISFSSRWLIRDGEGYETSMPTYRAPGAFWLRDMLRNSEDSINTLVGDFYNHQGWTPAAGHYVYIIGTRDVELDTVSWLRATVVPAPKKDDYREIMEWNNGQ